MIIKRLITLQVVLFGGFGSIFILPKDIRLQPAAITLNLPTTVGQEWQGVDQAVGQGERDILGPDTQFARKIYSNVAGDQILASVVLSGPDMNTSIHRPERCLPAQGWTVVDSKTVAVPVGNSSLLKTTRLHNIQNARTSNGQVITVGSLNYYWFVGHSEVTQSSFERTWIDIRDRALLGRNQQWAYVTVAATETSNIRIAGRTEKETDDLLQSFIGEFYPVVKTP